METENSAVMEVNNNREAGDRVAGGGGGWMSGSPHK